MQWKGRRRSTNVEDRRGRSSAGGRGMKLGGGSIFLILILSLLTGRNPLEFLGLLDTSQVSVGGGATTAPAPAGANDEQRAFVEVVLADTETTWHQIFQSQGRRYQEPTLVLFDDMVRSACGTNSSAVGPFYCPADQQVYIDLSFFQALHQRFDAPGDFARAYVIAHEVGHHVQNLLGISNEVHRMRSRVSQEEGNALSVRQELQADCFAGVWGHHAGTQRQLLERGDVEEGLQAAAAIGDDMMQRRAGAVVHPESWTHGSSQQRVTWFRRGLEHGDIQLCDTFATDRL